MSRHNGAWEHQVNRADVTWSDEEIFLLSNIDATWHIDHRIPANSLAEQEMRCQRDMKVRGRRLWSYHQRLGDLEEILGPLAWPMNIAHAAELLVSGTWSMAVQ